MTLKDLLPDCLKDHWKLLSLKRRFPRSRILSPHIGPKVRIGAHCSVARHVILANEAAVGDYTYLNEGTIMLSGQVGKYCSIGYYCQIGMHEHPVNAVSTSPALYGGRNVFGMPLVWDDFPAPPVIGHDVWIGSQALILQGVTIGDGAVIAGGSVVTKDVPPYAIVGGIPAKVIRPRFSEEQIAYLLKLRWWDLPLDKLRKLQPLFAAGDAWTVPAEETGVAGGR